MGTILMTKSNGNRVVKVKGEIEEYQVESWSIEDEGHDLMKFRLSTCIHKVEGCSFLDILDAA